MGYKDGTIPTGHNGRIHCIQPFGEIGIFPVPLMNALITVLAFPKRLPVVGTGTV
jgi:hypothetical protein